MNPSAELYACLFATEFPAQAALRLRPELRNRAVVVLQGDPPLQTVCSLNAKARQLGVTCGMTKVELDTFSSLVVLQQSRTEEVSAHAALLECAGAFSPRVEDRSSSYSFLCVIDIAGTEKLLGPPQILARELVRRVQALGVTVAVVISRNFHVTICCARGSSTRITLVAQGNEIHALAQLPIRVLELSNKHTETFSLWGIRTLGELSALPEKELIARIGQEGRRFRQLARGELAHHFVPHEAAFVLEEHFELDTPVQQLESLLFVLSTMLQQLIHRAASRVLALSSVTIRLSLEGNATHIRIVRPALPTNDRPLWVKLLHLDLEAHPPQAAILAVTLTAEPGRTSKIQLGLFSPQLPEPMRLDVTLARIRALVGDDCVGSPALRDTHRPDSFQVEPFKIQLTSSSITPSINSPSAMRQLRPPQRVAITLRERRPSYFFFRNCRYKVEYSYGPWLAGGDWWQQESWELEQWDLVARSSNDSLLYCSLVHNLKEESWQIVTLYD